MTGKAWPRARLLGRRLVAVLAWVLLVGGVCVAITATGIRVVGSIDGWHRWVQEHSAHLLAWRVLLYAATGYGWWRMRRRMLEREPSDETRQRFARIEIASVAALVLLEGSQLLTND